MTLFIFFCFSSRSISSLHKHSYQAYIHVKRYRIRKKRDVRIWFNEILSESLFTHREKGSMKEENCRTIYWPMWKMFILSREKRKKAKDRYRKKKKSDKKTWIALQLWDYVVHHIRVKGKIKVHTTVGYYYDV